jgi:hypothetical protein
MTTAVADAVVLRHRDLEQIANAALRMGRLLMECGGRVRVVHEGMRLVTRGLGAEIVTGPVVPDAGGPMIASSEAMLRVIFTLGAIGAGLAIPTHMTRHRGF